MENGAVYLNKHEIRIYFAVWIAAVVYSIYNVYLNGTYFLDYKDLYNDFVPGWTWLGRQRDNSDDEWKIWIPLLIRTLPWIAVQLLVAQFIKYKSNKIVILCYWYVTVSLHFLYYYIGILGILCILIQPCLACLLLSLRSKVISWIVHLITLIIINWAKTSEFAYQYFAHLQNEEYFMLLTAICWIQLRSISYGMDSIECYKHVNLIGFFNDLLQNAAYTLYLPTLFLGPIVLYSDFVSGISQPYQRWTWKRLRNVLLNIIRYTFWLYFTEFALHFVYVNALQYHPEVVWKMNPWALYGFGYCMGQYFCNKYIVIYGICGEISRIDDIPAPVHPKCVARIHLYSDMWKYFDRGLYKFLLRYIYIPTTKAKHLWRQIFASCLCFCFVFLWHGIEMFIFTWSVFNFVSLAIEGISRSVARSLKYRNLTEYYMSRQGIRRLHCALTAPLLALSAVSNFYFFAGQEVGNIFIYRMFHDPLDVSITVLFCLYCCCQVSTEMKYYETRKEITVKMV